MATIISVQGRCTQYRDRCTQYRGRCTQYRDRCTQYSRCIQYRDVVSTGVDVLSTGIDALSTGTDALKSISHFLSMTFPVTITVWSFNKALRIWHANGRTLRVTTLLCVLNYVLYVFTLCIILFCERFLIMTHCEC